MKKLAIIGAGDLGQLIAYHAISDCKYEVVGYFDDTIEKGTIIKDVKVIGSLNDITKSYDNKLFDCLMVGIGYNYMSFRRSVFEKYITNISFATLIHSSSYIDKSCSIGSGVFILPGCILDKDVIIGDNVLLNTGCVIAHDTKINDHSFLSPAVKIAGKTQVGKNCILGINSTIIDNITLVDGVKLGGGAVVINDLLEPGLYLGIPALFKKSIV
jgi:sugar O-acyltransferase (sialic acid O-acetyltransferase NeuD family)